MRVGDEREQHTGREGEPGPGDPPVLAVLLAGEADLSVQIREGERSKQWERGGEEGAL